MSSRVEEKRQRKEERAQKEEEAKAAEVENVEFAVLLVKQKDGNIGMRSVPDFPAAQNLGDVKSACQALVDSINSQYTANLVAQHMMQAATVLQNQGNAENRTEGGIVLPN